MDPGEPRSPADAPARGPVARRWWLNIALGVMIAALAVFAWYRSNHPASEAKTPLTTIDPQSITRVAIERPGQPAVALERRETNWRLTAPLEARANRFLVEALLHIAGAESEAQLPAGADALARYGLERPQALLKLDDETIGFGATHPLKPLHYVRYRDTVQLVASHYVAQLTGPYTNLIDTRLIEDGRRPVAFQFPRFTLTLREGTWYRQPDDKSISGDRINDFVEEWRHARALSVERYSRRAVLERIRVTFAGEGAARATLALGVLARRPELVLYRQDEGLEYHFPEDIGKRLLSLTAGDR